MFVLLLLLLLCILPSCINGVQVVLNVHETDCFYKDIESYHTGVSFNYEVIDGETDSIQVELIGPGEDNLYRHVGSEGRYTHQLEVHGLFKFCMSNTIDAVGPAIVGFAFHAEEPNQDVLSNADTGKIEHAQKVSQLVYELNVDLETVRDTMGYMKSRSYRHEVTAQSTYQRVAWWTLGESLTLIGLAVWQIYYLRRTFEVKRFL